MAGANGRRRVAILGGGVGAITTAWALSQPDGWQERLEITVYQQGWRLGGKGASGRNAAFGQRIEEHGLHIWAGFYENAFRSMRECYAELVARGLRRPEAPLATLDEAFSGLDRFYVSERVGDAWRPWRFDVEPNSAVPGTGGLMPSPVDYLEMALEWLRDRLAALLGHERMPAALPEPPRPLDWIVRLLEEGGIAVTLGGAGLLDHALGLVRGLPRDARLHHGAHHNALAWMLRELGGWLRALAREELTRDDELRRLYIMLDLGAAGLVGMIADGVLTDGFDPLDAEELTAWLRRHGASDLALESAVIVGFYDYIFGYPGGRVDRRGVGAGTALRAMLRLAFTFKGHFFYKMQAGMGDTVFAPYYQVLRDRGVRFEFFRRVTGLGLSADRGRIERIELVRQAEAQGGEYDPLVEVRGLPCWPSLPIYKRLEGGDGLRGIDLESPWGEPVGRPETLRSGIDFDEVVLGISLGALPEITQELAAASPSWRAMLDGVATVQTQAIQLWLTEPTGALGFSELAARSGADPGDVDHEPRPLLTSFGEPFDTWADMSHLLLREDWPGAGGPRSVAYFCNVRREESPLPPPSDHAYPARELARTRDAARAWLEGELPGLWPEAAGRRRRQGGHGFRWELLYDPEARDGPARLDAQYVRANLGGSERYVLSVPGSVGKRLPSGESGFENLYLAGDWTLNGINAGCVEAAAISGLAAARALSGRKIEIVGEGDAVPPRPPGLTGYAAQTARWPSSVAYATGRMDGWYVPLALPTDEVARMLPRDLEPAPQSITPRDHHPVILLFDSQRDVRPNLLPALPRLGDYLELILIVSLVRYRGGRPAGVFCHLPALHLDSLLPILAGRALYGFAKHRARIERGPDSYRVERGGRLVVEGRFREAGPTVAAAGFPVLHRLLDLPIVCRRQLGGDQYCFFDFGLEHASLQPVEAEVTAGAGLLPRASKDTFKVPHIDRAVLGAFRLWTEWTLTNPLDSRRIERLSAEHARFDAGPGR
jgi:uncharacterized protein with NAD-binding domain and iron-sulfur cluster